MKIAIYHNLPSGGAKRALFEMARRLCARHDLEVFTTTSANHAFADIRPFARAQREYPFETGRLLRSPWGRANQLVYLRDLARIEAVNHAAAAEIDRGGFDVAFIHPCRVESSPSVLYHLRNTRSVFFFQEPPRVLYETLPDRPYQQGESALHRVLDRVDPLPGLFRGALKRRDSRNLRAASRLLANSDYTRQIAARIYQAEARTLPLGVDTGLFRPLGLEREPFLFSVGSLTPLKGFDFLVRAIGAMPPERRLPLVLASNFQNPPERAFLTDLAARMGVQLTLLDGITDERLVALYNQARLTVYAPYREPLGFVPLESMACGTPVVAVAEGGVRETVLDGVVGRVTGRDEAAFARAVEDLLGRPDLLAEYGRAGRPYVTERWTWDRTLAVLEEALAP